MERQEIVLFLQELYKNTFLDQNSKMIHGAIKMLREDPVHTAGGVYCHECCNFDTKGYENVHCEPGFEIGWCSYWIHDTQACNFCSQGY